MVCMKILAYGVVRASFGDRSGFVWGSFSIFEFVISPLQWVVRGSFGDRSGVVRGSFGGRLGVVRGSCRGRSGLGSFGRRFRPIFFSAASEPPKKPHRGGSGGHSPPGNFFDERPNNEKTNEKTQKITKNGSWRSYYLYGHPINLVLWGVS